MEARSTGTSLVLATAALAILAAPAAAGHGGGDDGNTATIELDPAVSESLQNLDKRLYVSDDLDCEANAYVDPHTHVDVDVMTHYPFVEVTIYDLPDAWASASCEIGHYRFVVQNPILA